MMQRDGKAHNHFMAIVLLHLAFHPKILIKVCTKCLLYAWDKQKIITNVMNHFFLNLLYEWNVKLGQNNED